MVDVTMATMALLLLLILTSLEALDTCPEKCLCDVVNGVYDCRSAGLDEFPYNLPSPSSVKELLLSGNKLSRIDQLHLMLYKNIKKLDMSSCELVDIDETTFENNRNLTELRFGDNQISELKPKTFQGLGQLKYLDMTGNGMAEIGGIMFEDLRKLEKLDLSRNLLQRVADKAFLGLVSLEMLDMSVNQLRAVPVDSLSTLPSLRSLSLSGNAINFIPSHAFRSLRNLQKLQLQDNQITRISELAFHGKDSIELPKLKYLSLRTNRFTEVPTLSLQNLSSIVTLDLSDNPIHTLQQDSFTGLRRLRQLYINEMPKLVSVAPYSFSAMKNLEEIQLHRNVKLKHLPSFAFGDLPNLKQFDICCNGLTQLNENLLENWNQLQIFDLRLNPWHCDCQLAWLGMYLKNHSSSRIMSSVQCYSPVILRGSPVMKLDESSCTTLAAASSSPRKGRLSTVLYMMIGAVVGALLVVAVYVLYRNKGQIVKHFTNQMRYHQHEDQTGESMSSRLSIA